MSEKVQNRRRFPVFQILVVLVAVVIGVAVAAANAGLDDQDETIHDQGAQITILVQRLDKAEDERAALADQVRGLGEKPVVPVEPADPEPEPVPDPDPPWFGLDAVEVRAIVADELADRQVTLTAAQINRIAGVAASQIPVPKDGRPPTDAEVRTVVEDVVATVCADDQCRGPAGEDGQPGPPPSNEQLDARLAAYCSTRNDCVGPAGPVGPAGQDGRDGVDGTDGAPGRGITHVSDPYENDADNCVITLTFDREPTSQDIDVPESMCPLLGGNE